MTPPARSVFSAVRMALCLLALCLMARTARAQSYTLDDPASPVTVVFHGANGRMTVTVKATGAVWKNPDAGGGQAVTISGVTQTDATHLSASATTSSGYPVVLQLALTPSSGDLSVTISADPLLSIPATIQYPYAFFPVDGSGFMVMPVFGGYVVPTSQTAWSPPSSHSRLEWFGGVDSSLNAGWVMIGETDADMELTASTATVGAQQRRGGVFKWNGSNANAGGLAGRFSYDRRAVVHFFASGGYVAQAKRFREYAQQRGWLVTLAQKAQQNPVVDKIIGAPILYLWGDGRSQAMLNSLESAGIERAMVQVSINHVDQNNAFPNQQYAGGAGWANAVRAKGYVPGIYDIYARYSAGQSQPPFNGFFYLWPSSANPQWLYRNSDGTLDAQGSVNAAAAAAFARTTRLPAHNSAFGFDAYFSDVVCAVMPREDYDTTYGHAATRAQDIAGRQSLLAAVSVDHGKLAGVEQLKSWAVPYAHWGEGVFWLGGNPSGGAWNNNAYPEIMTDVKDPGSSTPSVLDVGWRVPLFDLVYHDCVLAAVHWHRPHNKFLYAWNLNDQFALLRGQAPLMNLVYNGDVGSVGRAIAGATDARDGSFWDTRWTNQRVRDRVVRTYDTVCAWHRTVGYLEMTDSRALTSDFSVQMSEFSNDGGVSGHGIVVNFGAYDGAFGMTGPAWTGQLRGRTLTVPVGGFVMYDFGACDSIDFNGDGLFPDTTDIDDFLSVFSGGPCSNDPNCLDIDFNNDGLFPDTADIDSLLSLFSGGPCF